MSKVRDEKIEKLSKKERSLLALRHTAEHVLHTAMQNLYPKLKKAMGPATDEGFYFDFDLDQKISQEDFPRIEKEMQGLIDADLPMVPETISVEKARKLFDGNPYKLEWISEIEKRSEGVSIYRMGDRDLDLCSGPHVKSTEEIKAFKLLSTAGAYWRGNEKNKMLTRIYGTCFPTKDELEKYLWQLEEAKKRDHKKIGQELDLFSFHEEGPGFVFWHPNGIRMRKPLIDFWQELHEKAGYEEVSTPILLNQGVWKKSGHWQNYKDKMYFTKAEGKTLGLKPMSCPGAIIIYKNRQHSYRELPIRWRELGLVHRMEPSGTLNGLFRERAFRQDDAHIFCTENQIDQEVKEVIDLALSIYKTFKFNNIQIELSTRPEKSIGSNAMWEKAESMLKKVLLHLNLDYQILKGEGAFYGPKIDFHLTDSVGRQWQCGTIQLDFAMPEQFDLTYIDSDGKEKRPAMIHRTIFGSIHRFFAILIEHYGGAFPLWLAPVQVVVIPIADRHAAQARIINNELITHNIRSTLDHRAETMQAKIRDATLQKVPYMLIIGDKEVESSAELIISIRTREGKDLGQKTLSEFIKSLKTEIEGKN